MYFNYFFNYYSNIIKYHQISNTFGQVQIQCISDISDSSVGLMSALLSSVIRKSKPTMSLSALSHCNRRLKAVHNFCSNPTEQCSKLSVIPFSPGCLRMGFHFMNDDHPQYINGSSPRTNHQPTVVLLCPSSAKGWANGGRRNQT